MKNPEPSRQNLVFNMPLNNGFSSGAIVFDESLNGFDGIAINSPVPSYPGFNFTAASTQYIDIGAGPTSVKTVSLWVKLDDVSGDEFVMDLNNSDYLTVGSGVVTIVGFTAPTLYVNGVVGTNGVTTIPALTWSHIAITDTIASNATDLDIGRVTTFYYDGLIADVRLYDAVLTKESIQSIFYLQRHKYGFVS